MSSESQSKPTLTLTRNDLVELIKIEMKAVRAKEYVVLRNRAKWLAVASLSPANLYYVIQLLS